MNQRRKECTQYQLRVYDLCKKIPEGKVSTYKALALHLKSSPRAVGQALKLNPFSPTVPCHRVISSNGKIGGFYGKADSTAQNKKMEILKAEGIDFVEEEARVKSIDMILFDDFS